MTTPDTSKSKPAHGPEAHSGGKDLTGNLRQMIAVLQAERQALATLDADALFEATHRKQALCDTLMPFGADALDPQARDLARTAQTLNDVNRRVRNLLAANVAARLEALGSVQHTYSAAGATLG
ncbi:flagellar protein FlgN [Qipengyuania sp. ASV99]|uniref:flagellar protein FlgN n=1 Tax=Qipengyuania sp. ASV99 TaxID=3399681 RepID=UPI003A4C63B0